MPNDAMVVIGCVIILLSIILFGGKVGSIIGFIVVMAGAFADSDYSNTIPNFKLLIFGGLLTFASVYFLGAKAGTLAAFTGAVFGVISMIMGLYFLKESSY